MRPSDEALLAEVHRHLAEGETLLWHDRPIPRAVIRTCGKLVHVAALTTIMLSGIGLALLSQSGPITRGDAALTVAASVAVVLTVAMLVLATRWHDARHSMFAITGDQILVVRLGRRAKRTSISRPNAWIAELVHHGRTGGTLRLWLETFWNGEEIVRRHLDLGVIADPDRPFALLRL